MLSALIPGVGQLYLRRPLRALLWFAPALVLGAAAVVALSMTTRDLIGTALEPSVLWSVFWGNIAGFVWRIGAAADAWFVARRPMDGGSPAAKPTPVTIVAWIGLAGFVLLPHMVVAQYSYDAATLIEDVFVIEGEVPEEPVIPIGTDADIVPDPVATAYDGTALDRSSNRNMVFREGLGDPDAIEAWPEVAE